ncbi:MAG: hypothetical protein M1838_005822 [Thelocarpon superellum]|nr:MAG: hypothetical protein M1838_005822 [Thelocarpon superellum]
MFALRAFQTALFGTPKETPAAGPTSPSKMASTTPRDGSAIAPDPALASPRRTGILLTPGTAAGRRKTVSFGESVVDPAGCQTVVTGRSGLPDNCPGKFPSPWTPRATTPAGKTVRTTLTQSLYDARGTTARAAETPDRAVAVRTKDEARTESAEIPDESGGASAEGDVTVDMEEPRSESGKYWMSELESYHEQSTQEMRKMHKYKEMAKSYAKKKDAEAMDLREKLRDERRKVSAMEAQMSSLARTIATARQQGGGDAASHERMMRELARQTALALECKDNIHHFQAALARHPAPTTDSATAPEPVTRSIRAEMDGLRQQAQAATQRAKELEQEKLALTAELARLKDEARQDEQRRSARQERQRAREERLEAEKKEYRERLVQARDEKRAVESTCAALRHELTTLTSHASSSGDASAPDHLATIRELRDQVRRLQSRPDPASPGGAAEDWQQQHRKTLHELRQAREESSTLRAAQDTMRREVAAARLEVRQLTMKRSKGHETADDMALLDRNVNSVREDTPAQALEWSHLASSRFPPEDSLPPLPSPEHLFSPGRKRLDSSPSRVTPRPTPSGGVRRSASAAVSSSRLGSPASARSRTVLPPERAAAAKARLEERKRVQERERGKENVRG